MNISFILLLTALILAILAAVGVSAPRINLGWAALACYFASLLV